MIIAIIGSRNLWVDNLSDFIPDNVTEIISGGARGIDSCAEEYAKKNNIKLTVFLPDYKRYKRGAPLIRNRKIIEAADEIIAFWDSKSQGTRHTIELCKQHNKKVTVHIIV